MKLIAEKNLKQSIKNYGYNSYDRKVHELIESSLQNFVARKLEKAGRVAQKDGKQFINEQHVRNIFQKGGAETTLPLEYFGVRTSHYSVNAPQGADMSVTAKEIRPAFLVNDLQGVIKEGGAQQFRVPFKAVNECCKNQSVRVQAQKLMQQKFEMEFTKVMRKVQKVNKTEHLSVSSLEQILGQKQYQKLFKQ